MTSPEPNHEARVLRMMKRVLTDIIKDTTTPPGMKHPLSDDTIAGIRDCLGFIATRERELAQGAGHATQARPRFVDEPAPTVVSLDGLRRPSKKDPDSTH